MTKILVLLVIGATFWVTLPAFAEDIPFTNREWQKSMILSNPVFSSTVDHCWDGQELKSCELRKDMRIEGGVPTAVQLLVRLGQSQLSFEGSIPAAGTVKHQVIENQDYYSLLVVGTGMDSALFVFKLSQQNTHRFSELIFVAVAISQHDPVKNTTVIPLWGVPDADTLMRAIESGNLR